LGSEHRLPRYILSPFLIFFAASAGEISLEANLSCQLFI
jgi:hypothetical protein